MITKILSKAKFDDDTADKAYGELPDLQLFKLNMSNILGLNEDTGEENNPFGQLKEYFDAFSEYRQIRDKDYADYKAKFGDKIVFTPVERAQNLAGNKLMVHTPYAPGTELYKSDQLNLVRYDRFMNIDTKELEEDEDEDAPEVETETQRQKSQAESEKVRDWETDRKSTR